MARMSEQDIKQECQNDIIQHAIYKITKNKAHINHYSFVYLMYTDSLPCTRHWALEKDWRNSNTLCKHGLRQWETHFQLGKVAISHHCTYEKLQEQGVHDKMRAYRKKYLTQWEKD